VKQQLASDPAFAMVQVAAHNGHVELTGSVSSKDDRRKAKEMAKSVPGVVSVKEHLSVGGGNSPTGSGMSGGQNTAGSISGNGQKSSAESGNMSAPPAANAPDTTPQQSPAQPTPPEANPQSAPPPSDTTPHASTTTTGGSGGRLVNTAYQERTKGQEASQNQQPAGNSADTQQNGTAVNATIAPDTSNNSVLQSQIESALRI
jgi:hypothetical protein